MSQDPDDQQPPPSQDEESGQPRPPPPPPSLEDNAELIELLMAVLSSPFEDQLDQLAALARLMRAIVYVVARTYRALRADINAHSLTDPVTPPTDYDEAARPALETNRRIYHSLSNMCRLFNPRRLALTVSDLSESVPAGSAEDKNPPTNVIVQLVLSLDGMVGYILEHGVPLMTELEPLIERVEAGVDQFESPEQLWSDLQALRTRVVAFVREVLNPALFNAAEAQLEGVARQTRNDGS